MSFSGSFSSGNKSSFLNYNELVRRDLKPGDLIEIDRGSYNHWAMFSNKSDNGTHWCFHVTTASGDFEKKSALMSKINNAVAGIKKHKLKDILEDSESKTPSQARINNKIEEAKRKKCGPLPIEEVIEGLEKRKDKPVKYNVKDLNCEHYATTWKYGTGWSRQVEVVKTSLIAGGIAVVGAVIFGIFAAAGAAGSSTKSTNKDDDYYDSDSE